MSEHTPPGVVEFTHKAGSSKGKFQPNVGTGFEDVTKIGGKQPAVPKVVTKASSHLPAGVAKHDGTKNYAPGKHMHGTGISVPSAIKSPFTPPGVSEHTGLSAPKKRK